MENSYCDHRNFDSVNQPLFYYVSGTFKAHINASLLAVKQ